MKFIIVGSGVAGHTAVATIKKLKPTAEVTLIGSEDEFLYSRILLRKYLKKEIAWQKLFLKGDSFYQQAGFVFKSGEECLKIDTQRQEVFTNKGKYFYDKLLLATGGQPNRLNLPGSDLKRINTFYTLADTQLLEQQLPTIKQAAVIGGGYIAADLLGILNKHQIPIKLFLQDDFFWQHLVSDQAEPLINLELASQGVEVEANTKINSFTGSDSVLEINTSQGGSWAVDWVGLGVGISRRLDYLKGSGVEFDQGILTNQFLETNLANVWAMGDVAQFLDLELSQQYCLGTWGNAVSQAMIAASNSCGQKLSYQPVVAYSSDFLTLNYTAYGNLEVRSETEVYSRLNLEKRFFWQVLIEQGIIKGALIINNPQVRQKIFIPFRQKKKVDFNFCENL